MSRKGKEEVQYLLPKSRPACGLESLAFTMSQTLRSLVIARRTSRLTSIPRSHRKYIYGVIFLQTLYILLVKEVPINRVRKVLKIALRIQESAIRTAKSYGQLLQPLRTGFSVTWKVSTIPRCVQVMQQMGVLANTEHPRVNI